MDEELAYPHSLTVMFRPGTHPADRGYFEDELEEALEEQGLGEVIGGGSAMDGCFCDISIDVADPSEALRLIREVLRRCEAPETTVIIAGDQSQRVEYPVYE
jgi:hypothetical protein